MNVAGNSADLPCHGEPSAFYSAEAHRGGGVVSQCALYRSEGAELILLSASPLSAGLSVSPSAERAAFWTFIVQTIIIAQPSRRLDGRAV